MIDIVKKTLLAGFGAAVVTKEAVEHALGDWIEKGKITPDEANGFAERLVRTGEEHWAKTKDDVSQKVAGAISRSPFAPASALAALDARVSVLEQIALREKLAADAADAPAADAPDASIDAAAAPAADAAPSAAADTPPAAAE
jgi:polyhydroxyalkanoate synthesis regulator phasin